MIELSEIRASVGVTPILRGVNLTLHDYEQLTVVGASGAGKSILLKTIIGILEPDGGSILMDGVDITDYTEDRLSEEVRPKISMVFQNSALWDSMTVRENVGLALNVRKRLSDPERTELVETALARVDLSDAAEKYPEELSGGMMKRTAIARAIAAEPRYILYDEPTTGLDPVLASMVIRLIDTLNEELGMTALIVSHDVHNIPEFSDTVAMLADGRIVATTTSDRMWDVREPVFHDFIRGKDRSEGALEG